MVKKAQAVKDDINKKAKEKHGKDLVMMASEVSTTFDIRLPTGLPGLDVALEGGIPRGIIAEIAGPDSTGKNALAYQIAGTYQQMRQKKCGVLLCPIEGEIDKHFARKLGFRIPLSPIEIKRMETRLGRKLEPQEKGDLALAPGMVGYIELDAAEVMLQRVLDVTKTDDFGLVIIDSVAAMLAQEDMERKEQGRTVEVQVGGERAYARNINAAIGSFINRFQQARKCEPHDRKNLTTVLMINQVRADVSGKSYLPWRVPGAYALKHGKRVDIWLDNGPWIKDPKTEKVIGHYVRWNIAKGQYGVHEHAKGSIPFRYETGFDLVEDLFNTLHGADMLTHTGGGKWDLCDGHGEVVETYGRDIGGKDGLLEAARNDPSVQAKWRTTLETIYKIPPIYEGYDE